MDTIGVLGGMGPAATVDFFARLLALAVAERDQDHPPCLLYSATQIPDRTRHLTAGGIDPTPELERAARVLEQGGAGLIAIPCNSAHAYHGAIADAVSIPVLDMIELAAARVRQSVTAGTSVGILAASGTIKMGLYDQRLKAAGLVPLQLPEDVQGGVMEAIWAIKAGSRGPDFRLISAIDEFVERGAGVIVLGCTELPLAIDKSSATVPIVDSTEVLARAALELAGVMINDHEQTRDWRH